MAENSGNVFNNFDVYISYAKEDRNWVRTLVEKLEQASLSVCWDVRDFEPDLSLSENRNIFVDKCSSCILVMSQSYISLKDEWSYYAAYVKNATERMFTKNKQASITSLLDNKGLLCILLSDCSVPAPFSDVFLLDWTEETLRYLFWRKLFKYLKSVKKKADIKKALLPNVQNSINYTRAVPEDLNSRDKKKVDLETVMLKHTPDAKHSSEKSKDTQDTEVDINYNMVTQYDDTVLNLDDTNESASETSVSVVTDSTVSRKENAFEISQKSEIGIEDSILLEEIEGENKVGCSISNYEMFDKVYPHLISNSFTAEDEDLTREEVDKLTLKMEDVESITSKETVVATSEKGDFGNQSDKLCENGSKCINFDSQLEQLHLLDTVQSLHERMQHVMNSTPSTFVSKRRRCRRLLKRYQDCIIKIVNGKKDLELLDSLPLIKEFLIEEEQQRGCRCFCCDSLFHSQRALDLHLEYCVKENWKALLAMSFGKN